MGWQVLAAYIADLICGDPAWLPHPVRLLGRVIAREEFWLDRWAKGRAARYMAGVFLAASTVGGAYFFSWLLLRAASGLNYWLGVILSAGMIFTTLAVRGLAEAAEDVYQALEEGDLELARKKLSLIVGRDTDNLPAAEVVRGTVETVAENIVDAAVSPLFYAFIGGAPLAMAYRAVNTLDSMVGYRNEKYRFLGWASARLDDAANYIPARITGAFLLTAAALQKKDWREAWRAMRRDAPAHPSPNSGIPEAAVAGALGIRLGGVNYYQGSPSCRGYLGREVHSLEGRHIKEAVGLLRLTSALAVLAGIIAWETAEILISNIGR